MSLPAADRHIDIERVDLDPITNAADTFRGDQRTARPKKTVQDNLPPSGTVEQGIGHKCDGLYGRMEGEKIAFIALSRDRIHVGVFPHVRPVAPILTQLHIVAMGAFAVSEYKDQLMARAIERSHPTVVFHPHAEVQE